MTGAESVVTTSNMPIITTTTSTTTTLMHTGYFSTGQGKSVVTTTATSVKEITVDEVVETKEPKRKHPDSNGLNEANSKKKRNTENDSTQTEEDPIVDGTSDEVTKRILAEMLELKSMMTNMDSNMSVMKNENKAWIDKLTGIEGDLNEVKASVEMAHSLIGDESSARVEAVKTLNNSIADRAREINNHAGVLKNHAADIKTVKENQKSLEMKISHMNNEQERLIGKLADHTEDVPTEYPIKSTIVAQKVWYRENEDLMKVALTIIHKGLRLQPADAQIVRVMRKSGQQTGSGLLKIELSSPDAVKLVLKHKSELKNNEVKELHDVYLRQSKCEETLIAKWNIDMVLRDMGVRDDYVRLASGHLVKKSEFIGRQQHHPARGAGG